MSEGTVSSAARRVVSDPPNRSLPRRSSSSNQNSLSAEACRSDGIS
ncbi:hypothetical protein [Natronorubrum sp. FCH18a]